MPLISVKYDGDSTPTLKFATSAIVKVNGAAPPAKLSTERVTIELATGQTWLILATAGKAEMSVSAAEVRFGATYTGYVRAAVAPTASAAELLAAHAAVVPTGGKVHATTAGGDSAIVTFAWEADGGSGSASATGAAPLMLALPHHLDVLRSPVASRRYPQLSVATIKGTMVGVLGANWTMRERLPDIQWHAPRALTSDRVEEVRRALKADAAKPLLAVDPYGGGKELGALGRLALIADELGEDSIASEVRSRLSKRLEMWLSKGGGSADALVYDPTYGGVVSSNGLADKGADFGNGWYNDHHFHYGYFLYAAAVVGKADPGWLHRWADACKMLVRDIANPSELDPLFTQMRFKDWFVGHAWASGLFPSASGRNQESVSESINAWYGLHLFGLALGDGKLSDLGRLMLATELRAGWRYWQLMGSSSSGKQQQQQQAAAAAGAPAAAPTNASADLYPAVFSKNHLAAVVWSTKVDRSTWFGSNAEYSYGIQTMPVTPISELWLRPAWVDASRPTWSAALQGAQEQWRGILLMMSAVNDPDGAWADASQLTLYDNGNTRTNTLHWIGTRAAATADSVPPPMPPTDESTDDGSAEGGEDDDDDGAARNPEEKPEDNVDAGVGEIQDVSSGRTALAIFGSITLVASAASVWKWKQQSTATRVDALVDAPSDTPYHRVDDA